MSRIHLTDSQELLTHFNPFGCVLTSWKVSTIWTYIFCSIPKCVDWFASSYQIFWNIFACLLNFLHQLFKETLSVGSFPCKQRCIMLLHLWKFYHTLPKLSKVKTQSCETFYIIFKSWLWWARPFQGMDCNSNSGLLKGKDILKYAIDNLFISFFSFFDTTTGILGACTSNMGIITHVSTQCAF